MISYEHKAGNFEIKAGAALISEISQISNPEKRQNVLSLYRLAENSVEFDQKIKSRAAEIRNISKIRTFDSYHIASAEASNSGILLTTDDKLIKMSAQLPLKVEVMNPITFMMRYMYGGEKK